MNMHDEDRKFLKTIREATDVELAVLYRWQTVESWRRVAIERELKRRGKEL